MKRPMFVAIAMVALLNAAAGWASPGQPDPGYGDAGAVLLPASDGYCPSSNGYAEIDVRDLHATGTGEVFIAGECRFDHGGQAAQGLFVAKLAADGSIAQDFGSAGATVVAVDSAGQGELVGTSLVVRHDAILVGGHAARAVVLGAYRHGFVVVRLSSDGSLDASFGQGGRMDVAFDDLGPVDARLQAMAADRGGRVLSSPPLATGLRAADAHVDALGGQLVIAVTTLSGGDYRPAVMRMDAAGALDAGFGNGGIVALDPLPGLDSFAGGVRSIGGHVVLAGHGLDDAFAARLLPGGAPDVAFGNAGVATANLLPDFGGIQIDALDVDVDGHIVAAGSAGLANPSLPALGLVNPLLLRWLPGGQLDAAFGDGGAVVFHPAPYAVPGSEYDTFAYAAVRATGIQSGRVRVHAAGGFVRDWGDAGVFVVRHRMR